jgi:hypothetical protein
MQVAYLVLSHRPPSQLRRLLSTLRNQDHDAPLIVHHDRFRSTVSESDVDVGGRVELLTSAHPIGWGDFSQVEVYWRMLGWMIDHVDFDWVVLLSAQDCPIKPLSELRDMLEHVEGDAILSARAIDEIPEADQRVEFQNRYYYQYAEAPNLGIRKHLPNGTQKVLRSGARVGADVVNRLQSTAHVYKFPDGLNYRVGRRARTTPFSSTAPCWQASSWATLSQKAAETVVSYARDNADYVSYYQSTVLADESATATILCNDPATRVADGDLHHVRWSNALSGHPDIFHAKDVDELAMSSKYFARKFDIDDDAVVLDRLDDLIARP